MPRNHKQQTARRQPRNSSRLVTAVACLALSSATVLTSSSGHAQKRTRVSESSSGARVQHGKPVGPPKRMTMRKAAAPMAAEIKQNTTTKPRSTKPATVKRRVIGAAVALVAALIGGTISYDMGVTAAQSYEMASSYAGPAAGIQAFITGGMSVFTALGSLFVSGTIVGVTWNAPDVAGQTPAVVADEAAAKPAAPAK